MVQILRLIGLSHCCFLYYVCFVLLTGRTVKAIAADGTEKSATVFSAIAATDLDGDTLQVELNSTKNGM